MTIHLAEGEGFQHVGATLNALRGLWNVSEARMALACGVSRPTLQNRFKGVGPAPRADEMERYAKFFGLPGEVLKMSRNRAVVVAIEEHGFLDRTPAGPGGEKQRRTGEVIPNTEWSHETPRQWVRDSERMTG